MKKQVLMVALLGATVSYLHGAAAAGQTSGTLEEGVDQVFDKLYEVQELLLSEHLISEGQQARLRQLATKRGRGLQNTKALLEMASDLLDVLEDAATKSKKTNLVTNFDTIKSRIADLTRQEEQQKKQRLVGKLPQQTPAAPPVAAKPKKMPPAVAAKPKKSEPLPVAAQQAVVAEPVVEPVVTAPAAARPTSVEPAGHESDEDVLVLEEEEAAPQSTDNKDEDDIIVLDEEEEIAPQNAGTNEDVIILSDSDNEEPAAVVLPATMAYTAPAPAIALAVAEPVRVVANAEREAVLQRVLDTQIASATQWGAAEPGKPWELVAGKTLFAGIQQIPGFQFLDEDQQAAFNPGRANASIYQKTIAAPAANVVIELLQSDGMGYTGANRKYRLGERSRSGESYLSDSVIRSALRETLGEYSARSWLTNPMVLQVLQKVSQPGFEPNPRIENEVKAKNAFDDAVRAILALDDLFAQQLRFKSEEHQALMRDIELFRTQGGNRDDLKGRIQRAMTMNEELNEYWAGRVQEDLVRMVDLSDDQRGTIASVIRELAGVERAAVTHAAAHALAAERPAYTPEERLRIFTEFMTAEGRHYSDFEIWKTLFREAEVLTLYRDLMAQVPHGQNPVFGNVMDEAKFELLREFENPENVDALNRVLTWYMVANDFKPESPRGDRDKEAKLLTAIVDKYREAIYQLFAQNEEKMHDVLMALRITPFSPHHAKMKKLLERINQERGQVQTTQGIEALRTHLLAFDQNIHTLQELVGQKLVPLDRAAEELARAGHDPEKLLLTIVERYQNVLENTLWDVQSTSTPQGLVTAENIYHYLARIFQDQLHYKLLKALAQAVFAQQGTDYSHRALGRFFYINRDTLKHEPTLLGSLFGISADVLQQELQKGLANVNEEQLVGIVRDLLTQNGLADILGQHVGRIVEFLTALREAATGKGYDLVFQYFPAQ